MKIRNQYNEDFNIGHFQGKADELNAVFEQQVEQYRDNDINCPGEITIITTFTDKNLAHIIYQFERNGIPYVNAADEMNGEWSMPLKVGMIYKKLLEVTTPYVLILDSYDTLVYNFDNILEKFHSMKCGILFNATKNNFPNTQIDKMPFRDYIGDFKYFNAGCCIGFTQDAIAFYGECIEFMNHPDYTNPYNSEQFVLRNIFAKYSDMMLTNYVPVKIDYNCTIFCCLGNGVLYKVDDEEYDDAYILK